MKRSSALAPLSRDHQHALDAALRLRRADTRTVTAAIEHFQTFFAAEGSRHFEIEEQCLAPALPAADAEWHRLIDSMRADHAAIRHAASRLATNPERVEAARSLGELLHDHVRFEERILFELLEQRLTDDELDQLATALTVAERRLGQPPR